MFPFTYIGLLHPNLQAPVLESITADLYSITTPSSHPATHTQPCNSFTFQHSQSTIFNVKGLQMSFHKLIPRHFLGYSVYLFLLQQTLVIYVFQGICPFHIIEFFGIEFVVLFPSYLIIISKNYIINPFLIPDVYNLCLVSFFFFFPPWSVWLQFCQFYRYSQ